MATKRSNDNLMQLTSVIRKTFAEGTTDMDGKSISGQSYFEITLKELNQYNLNVIGGISYKKMIFKNDRLTKDIFDLFLQMFKNEENKWTLKTDEPHSLKSDELFVEAYGATIKLECPYRNKDMNGKWRTPITAVSIVAMGRQAIMSDDGKVEISPATGEDPIAIKNRILKNFNYTPIDNIADESDKVSSDKLANMDED